MKAKLFERKPVRLHGYQPKDFYFAFSLAALAVLIHTWAQIAEVSRAVEFRTLKSPTIPYLYLIIELGLIVNLIGLWFRTATAIRSSIIALLCVGICYAVWYAYSRKLLELLLSNPVYRAHSEIVPHHLFGLVGATWFNLAVLLMSGVLFVWEVKILRSRMLSQP
jgi:hypothetical protein